MKNLGFFSKIVRQAFGTFALALLLPLNCALAQGTWTQKADMPFFKNHHSAAASGGKIYLFGGGPDSSACTDEVWEYDPAADSFIVRASMPVALCGAAAVEVDGKIYLFGGYTTFAGEVSNAALEYDVANNSWKALTSMPTARGYASANSSLPGLIWVLGGGNAFGTTGLTEVEIYHVATDTWKVTGPGLLPLPSGRWGLTSQPHSSGWGFLVFGGAADMIVPAEETVLLFDWWGGWYGYDAMPTRRVLHGSNVIGDKIFFMGGMSAGDPVYSSVDMFDMNSKEWATAVAPMLTARRAFGNGVVNGKIYVFGGNNESGVLKSVEVFDPGDLLAAPEPFAASGAELLQNTPNPFGDETVISFSIAKSAQVDLSVFDLNGRKKATLADQFLSPGTYAYRLDAGELETGIYYYRLLLDGFKPEVRKMVVVK